ncbi:MAG: transcriptional repressor [Endomicrobiaceae bacterium]|nr:transcriptional repressor [Endomicrobiaceae bacterium]
MKKTRKTIQKELIFETVRQMKNHPTAEQLCQEIQKRHPTISKATVYRNLRQLSKIGKIKHIEMPDSADRFDHFTDNHYHIKCNICERVFDVDMPYFDKIAEMIKDNKGFKIETHDLVFKGVCRDCKKDKK